MLIHRHYKPIDDEIIYHYCDANAFLAICTNKKMRFSDVYSMNDFLEVHWGYSIWEKAAGELLEEVGKEFLDQIDTIISSSGLRGLPLASCFSSNGDVLSQWRAYADDGKGYAIGFSAKDLVNLPVRPLKVLYDREQQIKEMTTLIRVLHEAEQSEEIKFGEDFFSTCFSLAMDLTSFKNPAFLEEQEVRLLHVINFSESNQWLKLVDNGGTAFGEAVKGNPVLFRMRDNVPVAFIEQDFTNNGKVNPIKEVIIGPKNDAQASAISIFLETVGVGSVDIRRSEASYR